MDTTHRRLFFLFCLFPVTDARPTPRSQTQYDPKIKYDNLTNGRKDSGSEELLYTLYKLGAHASTAVLHMGRGMHAVCAPRFISAVVLCAELVYSSTRRGKEEEVQEVQARPALAPRRETTHARPCRQARCLQPPPPGVRGVCLRGSGHESEPRLLSRPARRHLRPARLCRGVLLRVRRAKHSL